MKKLYLHIGFHKTATSSFQKTCAENVNLLKKNKLIYPLFNSEHINKKNIDNHAIPIVSMFTDRPENYHPNRNYKVNDVDSLNRDYFTYLKSCLLDVDNVIISGEGILTSLSTKELFQMKKNQRGQVLILPLPFLTAEASLPFQFPSNWV